MKETFRQKANYYRKKISAFSDSPLGKQLIKAGTYLLQVLIVGIIVYQLSTIGWNRFFSSLPTHPFFYLLFLVIYFLLPLSETLAYKICWGIKYFRNVPVFIHKRIFNKDVMGYSGEIVLMQWANTMLPVSRKQAFKDIRDMNIISSAASTLVALALLLVLIALGKIRALDHIFTRTTGDYIILTVIALALLLVAFRFRKYLFSMSFSIAGPAFLIHSVRMILIYGAQILQWHIVLPDIGLDIWFTFLSVNIIISRIPFIPNHELVATGTNIELARVLNTPVAPIAGLFLAHNVLDKIFNLLFYLFLIYRGERNRQAYVVTNADDSQ